jgi:hypothetical protein
MLCAIFRQFFDLRYLAKVESTCLANNFTFGFTDGMSLRMAIYRIMVE